LKVSLISARLALGPVFGDEKEMGDTKVDTASHEVVGCPQGNPGSSEEEGKNSDKKRSADSRDIRRSGRERPSS